MALSSPPTLAISLMFATGIISFSPAESRVPISGRFALYAPRTFIASTILLMRVEILSSSFACSS